jgi:hypothetical protein
MLLRLVSALLFALLPLAAEAANCSSNPFTLTNGQIGDATQVMSNFNNLLNCANNNLAHNAANSDITSLSGLSTPLSVSQGGTGLAAAGAVGNGLVSDGTIWTSAGLPIWTTGDVKATLKVAADTGWVMMNDGTIGNATSGGTTRANADTVALFTLLWNNTAQADCPVSGGARGASAAADYAASKTIALPKILGRALAAAGAGAGLTARALANVLGEERHTLTSAEVPATPVLGSVGQQVWSTGGNAGLGNGGVSVAGGPDANVAVQGGGAAHNVMQPTTFLNVMVKL